MNTLMRILHDKRMREQEAEEKRRREQIELFMPMMAAVTARKCISFVFLSDVDARHYCQIEYEGVQRTMYVGHLIERAILKWVWNERKPLIGSVCEVRWAARPEVWIHSAGEPNGAQG